MGVLSVSGRRRLILDLSPRCIVSLHFILFYFTIVMFHFIPQLIHRLVSTTAVARRRRHHCPTRYRTPPRRYPTPLTCEPPANCVTPALTRPTSYSNIVAPKQPRYARHHLAHSISPCEHDRGRLVWPRRTLACDALSGAYLVQLV